MIAAIVWTLIVAGGPVSGHISHPHGVRQYASEVQCKKEGIAKVKELKRHGEWAATYECQRQETD